jgi:DNA-binding LacI/PurR family transcriptional regulator
LPALDRRVTAREVAERAGVSISAVSRAFTKGASVSAATREKVLGASKALGYQPNLLARSLMTRRTELIGLVSNNFDNPAFMQIFDLFTRHLQERSLRPLLANLSNGEGAAGALDMLLQYNVDGVIIASSTLPPALGEACVNAGLPVVLAFGSHKSVPPHAVGANDEQGGRLAGDTMLERGYRAIAFLGGPQSASSTKRRLRGLRASLKKAGQAPALEIFADSYSHEAGAIQMGALLQAGKVDAVFCGDDILAMGAIDACRQAGVDVPGDIGVIGFNDIPMAAWPAYDLTTIRQPLGDIIVSAVDMLLEVVDDPQRPPEGRLFPCEAIIRGTLRSAGRRKSRRD